MKMKRNPVPVTAPLMFAEKIRDRPIMKKAEKNNRVTNMEYFLLLSFTFQFATFVLLLLLIIKLS